MSIEETAFINTFTDMYIICMDMMPINVEKIDIMMSIKQRFSNTKNINRMSSNYQIPFYLFQ